MAFERTPFPGRDVGLLTKGDRFPITDVDDVPEDLSVRRRQSTISCPADNIVEEEGDECLSREDIDGDSRHEDVYNESIKSLSSREEKFRGSIAVLSTRDEAFCDSMATLSGCGAQGGSGSLNQPMMVSHQKAKCKPTYHRHPKPPFSYIALIAMAIRDSPSGKLTLAEINEYLMKKFPFFRGSYTGWRNSVRHNLSLNECFRKILRDPSRPWGKDNYWTINETSEYTFADGVFRRRRKRISKRTMSNLQKSERCDNDMERRERQKFSGPFSIDSILGEEDNSKDSDQDDIDIVPNENEHDCRNVHEELTVSEPSTITAAVNQRIRDAAAVAAARGTSPISSRALPAGIARNMIPMWTSFYQGSRLPARSPFFGFGFCGPIPLTRYPALEALQQHVRHQFHHGSVLPYPAALPAGPLHSVLPGPGHLLYPLCQSAYQTNQAKAAKVCVDHIVS